MTRGRKPGRRELERRLGIPLGKTLAALVEAAWKRDPVAPGSAFESGIHLILPWIGSRSGDASSLRARHTPASVLPFATGRQLVEIAFLMTDPDLATDERPIVLRAPKRLDLDPHVIAPDLASFLGLAAVAGVEDMDRSWTDADWRAARRARLDGPGAAEFRAESRALLAIPGVRLPKKPRSWARAAPDIEAPAPAPVKPRPRSLAKVPANPGAALAKAEAALSDGDHARAEKLARAAMASDAHAIDAAIVLVWALLRSGRTAEARVETAALVARVSKRPRRVPEGTWERMRYLLESKAISTPALRKALEAAARAVGA